MNKYASIVGHIDEIITLEKDLLEDLNDKEFLRNRDNFNIFRAKLEISLKKCEKLRAKFATSKFEENLNLYKPVDIPTKRRVKTKLDVRYVKPDTSTQKDNRDEHKAENDLIARTHNLKLSGEQNSGDGKHIKNAILAKDGDENIDSDHHDRDCIFGW